MMSLDIDLVSDIVCPWCAIGFARLRRALSQLDNVEVCIRWHPFVLNPDLPAGGRNMIEHLAAKYGKTPEQIQASQQQIIAAARALGLDFERAAERRSYNTFDTHRVLHYAREAGVEQAFNEKLFDAYFGRAADPTDSVLLRDTGIALGLDGDLIETILGSELYADAVSGEIDRYRQLGVSAVPAFIVNNQYLISGAQPPEALAEGLRRIAAEDQEPALP